MRSTAVYILGVLLFPVVLHALDSCGIDVKPYGFVASDLFYDSRQVLAGRDDFSILWPKRVFPDRFGTDINAKGSWNITAIHTRFGIAGTWNAQRPDTVLKIGVEGDLLGPTDPLTGTFRLRLAYVEIFTPRWIVLAGQYWHPLFVLDCFPDTIAFNNGVPMETLSRVPMLKFVYKGKNKELVLAAAAERDFTTAGPQGFVSDYHRNSVTPNLHMQLRVLPDHERIFGLAIDFKRIVPRLETRKGFAERASVNNFIGALYAAHNHKRMQLRSKIIYAQNASSQTMLSGFAVATQDPVTDRQTYVNTRTVTGWIDGSYWCDDETSFGVFAGYAKNIGAKQPLFINPVTQQPIVFAIDPEIDFVTRLSPRFRYRPPAFQFGVELEFNRIAYGPLDQRARVISPTPTNEIRLLVEILYYF